MVKGKQEGPWEMVRLASSPGQRAGTQSWQPRDLRFCYNCHSATLPPVAGPP